MPARQHHRFYSATRNLLLNCKELVPEQVITSDTLHLVSASYFKGNRKYHISLNKCQVGAYSGEGD